MPVRSSSEGCDSTSVILSRALVFQHGVSCVHIAHARGPAHDRQLTLEVSMHPETCLLFHRLASLSSLSSPCRRPYVRQLAPGASPSRPAPRAAISRAGRAIPRRNQRFRPGGVASPAEAQPPSTLSLKSSARIELLVARCAAVSSRIGRSACRAPPVRRTLGSLAQPLSLPSARRR